MSESPDQSNRVDLPTSARTPTQQAQSPEQTGVGAYPIILSITGFLIVGLFGWVAILAQGFLEEKFDNLAKQSSEINKKVGEATDRLGKLRENFDEFKIIAEKEHDRLHKTIQTVKKTLPQEIQDQIDIILGRYTTTIEQQRLQVEGKIKIDVEKIMGLLDESAEAGERQRTALEKQVQDFSNILWRLNPKRLQDQLQQMVNDRLEPIVVEWKEAYELQSRGDPLPNGLSFILPGVRLVTKPEVRVRVANGTVSLVGVLPSGTARTAIIRVAEEFRPRPGELDLGKLKVQP